MAIATIEKHTGENKGENKAFDIGAIALISYCGFELWQVIGYYPHISIFDDSVKAEVKKLDPLYSGRIGPLMFILVGSVLHQHSHYKELKPAKELAEITKDIMAINADEDFKYYNGILALLDKYAAHPETIREYLAFIHSSMKEHMYSYDMGTYVTYETLLCNNEHALKKSKMDDAFFFRISLNTLRKDMHNAHSTLCDAGAIYCLHHGKPVPTILA